VPGGAWPSGCAVRRRTPDEPDGRTRWCACRWPTGSACATPGLPTSSTPRALAWVKENIADYGGDPDFVAISGGSAGGHLTALAALTPNEPEWQPGFESADTSVVAAVPIYGRYDWFTREGTGRPEFIGILQRFIVNRVAKRRIVAPDGRASAPGRATVLRAARRG
jgi:acetyl esterase/lipase